MKVAFVLAVSASLVLAACGSDTTHSAADSIEAEQTISLQSPVGEPLGSITIRSEEEIAKQHEEYIKKYSTTDFATIIAEVHKTRSSLGSGSPEVCAALKDVKLPCDYDTRIELSRFLAVNGKGLFPAKGGTNPYVSGRIEQGRSTLDDEDDYPDDVFIGQPIQNKMLAKAVHKNRALFKGGTLQPEDVRKRWL